MIVTSFQSARHWLLLVLLMACAPAAMAAPPDLTAGELRTDSTDSNLGPTGMRGWIYDINGDCFESRQILVTDVEAGSPAAGILAANDVILGADGTGAAPVNFTADARKSLGYAIGDAEARNPAILQLLRWRAGVTDTVQITLQTLGAYSATAPYNCPKSAAILEQGLQYVMANESAGLFSLGTLTLLAADDPSNPNNATRQARAYAEIQAMLPTPQEMAAMNSDVVEIGGKAPWTRGHELIVLAEYYLKTNDPSVLPAIEAHVNTIANGQSIFGSMGHQWASPWPDGSLNGPVGGYGAVNSAAVPCFYGLLLAKECGITHPKLDAGIARASRFFASYSGKGSIPYGEHGPGTNHHSANGKSGLAALAFELQDHRAYARDYFAQMAVASSSEREFGHTGYGFNVLWSPLGAAVGGEEAASSYFSRAKWNFDIARRWDGGFDYGAPIRGTSGRQTGWKGMKMSTPLLLTYALPLRQLQITGKNRAPEGCLTPELIDRAVLAEEYDPSIRSTHELLDDLQSFSARTRTTAAAELANRPAEKEQLLVTLTAQANDLNGTLRTGACEALGIIGDPRSAPVLTALLTDDDNNVRYFAARGLRQFPPSVLKPLVYPILAAAAANAKPTFALPEDDPAQFANAQLIELLFRDSNSPGSIGILKDSLEGIDRDYLYPAIRMAATHPLGDSRATMKKTFALLTDEDVNALADVIVDAIHYKSPGGTMGAGIIRVAGLDELQPRNIAEGVPLAMALHESDGRYGVSAKAIEIIGKYAGSATLVQPDPRAIEFLKEFWVSEDQWDGNLWPDALAALNAIAADTNPVAPTPFKGIQSVTADAPTLTLPVNWTSLRVKSFDYAKGDSRYTWRKVHGAGLVSFFPNGTASSKNTHVLFDGSPGQYLFEVTMSDSRGFTEVRQTVAVTLRDSGGSLPPNDPPTADAQTLTIGEATPTPITLTGHDPEGYALNYQVTAPPAHGELSGTAPYLVYTSDFNYTGADSFTFQVMDSDGQVATATVSITVDVAAPTGLAIYEPFDYPAGALNGQSGTSEVGFSGPWITSSDASIVSDSVGYGPLPTKGGKYAPSNLTGKAGHRPVSPSALAANGLLADGATLWFSATAGSLATGNASVYFALANSPFATGSYLQNEGAQSGAGLGFRFSMGSGFRAATFGNTSGSMVLASWDNMTQPRYYNGDSGMVVGKITWGATPEDFDTIEIYEPYTDLLLPARPTTVLTTKVDQTTFDTIAIYRGDTPLLDEIRFGSSYQSVLLGSVAMTADTSSPVPNPLGFHRAPAPFGPSSIRMEAVPASDPHGVEYYFTCTAGGGQDSGWQSSPEYIDTGLTPGVTYTYTVKARDLSPARNETAPSTAFSATMPTSTLVPVVLNLSQAEAEATITSNGFTVGAITTAPSSSVDEGDVAGQTPAAGTSAALGTAVDLVISETVQLAAVPDVVGQTQSAATTALATQELVVGTVFTDYSESVPAGQIISTSPVAGSQVAFGSTVNFLVSAGSINTLLPLTELLFENFESPSTPTAYVQGSLPDNGKWVGSGSTSRGITDKAGGDFTAPDPNHQAFALRYKQTGITTAEGALAILRLNTRYSLSFDVMRDGIRSPGTGYICELVAFDPGITRSSAGGSRLGAVLASAVGNAPSDGSIARISLEFTAEAANPHLGKDIAIRIVAPYSDTNALIDNVSLWAVGVPLADTVPPILVGTSPADGATGFPINEFPTLTFSEPIAAGTGAVLLRNVTDGIQQFLLTNDPSVAIITGNTLRLLPPGGLLANKEYTVLVDLTAVTDVAGNRYVGISDPTAWNFTTTDVDLSPPTMTIANEQTSDTVYVGDEVTYTLAFSERIDDTTLGAADFGNAGTATFSIGAITETSAGLFSVLVTPTSTGTLQLQVNAGAVITDLAGNPLDTASPIADEGIITVIPPNLAPVWAGNPINKTAVNVGVSYSATLANDASDAESDPLIFTKISGPAWLTVAVDGTLSGSPDLNDVGLNSFTVGVSDGISPAVQATLHISVLPLTDPTPSSLFLYFDGGTVDIAGTGNGASAVAGSTGTWDTTIKNWDAGVGNPYVAWNNLNGDNALIAGGAAITIGEPITVGTLTFASGAAGGRVVSGSEITINNGMSFPAMSTLSFTAPIKLGGSQTWVHNQTTANSSGKSISGGTMLNYRTLTWDTTNVKSNNRITHQNITGSGSIIKNGTGWLGLGGTNTYTGSTTINAGTIDATSSTALGNANNQLTVNAGTLNMSGVSLSVGNLTGTGGVITSTSTSGTRLLTIGSGDNGGGNFHGVIDNGAVGNTIALTKIGTGTITLSGTNTYTGATIINNGTLFLTGATQGTTSIAFAAGSLGLDTGFPVIAASAAVDLSNGAITVTGTPVAESYTLLTASSITGDPVLADPIPGYALQIVNGTELRLVFGAVGPNDPPVFTANPILGADATQAMAYTTTLAGTATDANGDTLTFAKVNGPAWLSVAEDGTLTGTPTNSDVGENEFTVSVSDGIAAAVEATMAITVININDAPVWTSNPVIGPDAAALQGYSATLAEFAADVDPDTFLAFSLEDGPSWLSVDSDGTISGTPGFSDAGLNVFTVSVSDGIAEPVNATLHITVIGISDVQMWKTSFGEADLSDLAADYDGDGLSNGEERIWGLDPTKGSSRNPIITPLDPATGKFRYTRRDPARTGKTFTVWTSADLADWTQDTAATQLPGPMVDFIETVEITLTAPPANGRLFVRVHASD